MISNFLLLTNDFSLKYLRKNNKFHKNLISLFTSYVKVVRKIIPLIQKNRMLKKIMNKLFEYVTNLRNPKLICVG